MANIKRKIENLKPGKEYLLTVRAKNADLNVKSDYTDTIRFVVPQDSTIPESINNLQLYASFQKVMFVFDYSSDMDIDQYEYELYDSNVLQSAVKVSSGFNAANVFTVSVDNSYMTDSATPTVYDTLVSKSYWGRVRGIDTTGNAGPWTVLVETDSETPLIEEQFIDSLTASKITAGIIGAQTITLNGANSILKSTNFNGTLSSPGNYTGATQGWLINGIGNAYLANADIRGSVSASEFNLLDNNGQVVSQLGQVDTLNFGSYDHGLLFNNLDSRTGQNAGIGWTTHNYLGNISITNAINNTPSAGLVTCYVSSHNFSIGDYVYISGVNPSSLLSDGYYLVFDVATGSFSVVAPSATGSYISGGTVFWGYNHYLSIVGPSQTSKYPAEFRLYNDYNESSGYQLIAGSKAIGTWTEINSTYDAGGSSVTLDAQGGGGDVSSFEMTSGGSPGLHPTINLTTEADGYINAINMGFLLDAGDPQVSSIRLGSNSVFIELKTEDYVSAPSLNEYSVSMGTSDIFYRMNNYGEVGIGPAGGTLPWSVGTRGSAGFNRPSLMVVDNDANSNTHLSLRHTALGTASSDGLDLIVVRSTGQAIIRQRENAALLLGANNTDRIQVTAAGNFAPITDNSITCGGSGNRWTQVWAVNGTIQTSDVRDKINIANTDIGLDFINSLRPVKYKFIVGGNSVQRNDEDPENPIITQVPGLRTHYGLIAQEVKEVIDSMAVEDFGGWILTDLQDPDSDQGLRYEEFIAPIIKAVQELSNKITAIENHLGL